MSNLYAEKSGFSLKQIHKLIDKLPHRGKTLNGKLRPIEEILEENFFTEVVPDTWNKQSFDEGRLFTCARTCGNHELCVNSQQYDKIAKSDKP